MAATLIDGDMLNKAQRVELYEDGRVCIIQAEQIIKLDATSANHLLDFLLWHKDRLAKYSDFSEQ